MSRILSGIQPTGSFHLGNYLGAIQNWVRLQDEYEAFYSIVDLHALTTRPSAEDLREGTHALAIAVLASGVDPEKAVLFVQSAVPEHSELAWVFQCLTQLGDLNRMTQFKDKSEQMQGNINAGLFTYPVLQAADIAIYRATHVPVGEDQVQHLELTREIIRRFTHHYGELFPEPQVVISKAPRVMGLDGKSKMSKSKNNYIGVLETPDQVRKKLRSAVTDPQRVRRDDPGRPEVCNIWALHQLFTSEEKRAEIYEGCTTATMGCVDCKGILAEGICKVTEPIRERALVLEGEPDKVKDILRDGQKRASAEARKTMDQVKERCGLWRG